MAILKMESFQTTESPADTGLFLNNLKVEDCEYRDGGRDGHKIAHFFLDSEGASYFAKDNTSGGIYFGARFFASITFCNASHFRFVFGNETGEEYISLRRNFQYNGKDFSPPEGDFFLEVGMDDTYFEARVDSKTAVRIEHSLGSPTFFKAKWLGSSFTTIKLGMQDLYVTDKSTAVNNNFLGDVKIDAYAVNGDASNNGFTASGGGDLYTDVDEWPVSLTDYIEGVNIGSSYQLGVTDMPLTDTPLAVRVVNNAAKMAATDSGIKMKCDVNGTIAETEKLTLPVTGYKTTDLYFNTAPDGTEWTAAKVNSMTIGAEIVA